MIPPRPYESPININYSQDSENILQTSTEKLAPRTPEEKVFHHFILI